MNKENYSEDRPFILAKEEGDIIFVEMGGALNSLTLPESRKLVDEIIEYHGIYKRRNLKILIDYKKVKSIDSATIANILERLREHEKYGHKMAFVNIPKTLKDLIILHKLQDEIVIFKSKKQALKEFKSSSQ